MLTTRIILKVLATALLCLAVCAGAASAATVTVRVEGSSETLLPADAGHYHRRSRRQGRQLRTLLLRAAMPSARSRSRRTANWIGTGRKLRLGYSVGNDPRREPHVLQQPTYWAFWIDNAYSEKGICEADLHDGDTPAVLPRLNSDECPPPPNPLGIEAPALSHAGGSRVPVTVTSYAERDGHPLARGGRDDRL